jgi:hypothetical protein
MYIKDIFSFFFDKVNKRYLSLSSCSLTTAECRQQNTRPPNNQMGFFLPQTPFPRYQLHITDRLGLFNISCITFVSKLQKTVAKRYIKTHFCWRKQRKAVAKQTVAQVYRTWKVVASGWELLGLRSEQTKESRPGHRSVFWVWFGAKGSEWKKLRKGDAVNEQK